MPAPGSYEYYEAALGERQAPLALVDLDAMWRNGADLVRRAAGKPIRVASKSLRCRALMEAALRREGFRGLMTFTLAETLWLHQCGFDDLLLAYPTADRDGIRALSRHESGRPPILMVDSTEHLDFIARAASEGEGPIRVCIEFDTSFRFALGRASIGTKRSPLRKPDEVAALAREVVRRPRFELAALMGYEGHIAGVGDEPLGKPGVGPLIRWMQGRSVPQVAEQRAAIVEAVRQVAPVEIVNGGGTGSVHHTAREKAVTEVTAGSGFYAPLLFDRYSSFTPAPAAMFALPVVRRPGRRVATLLGGGYLASGVGGADRVPQPHLPAGLKLHPLEGAGEVQTPVTGKAADGLRIGDRVYMRHAKAGELCERFRSLLLVSGGEVVDEVPTYRGDGRCFL